MTTVASGATLGGHGTVGAVSVQADGLFSPGNSPGIIHTGNLSLAAGAHFVEQIGGAALAAAALGLGLLDELNVFRVPVVLGGGTPHLPPTDGPLPLVLVGTSTWGAGVVHERYRVATGEP